MVRFQADGNGRATRILVLGCGHVDGLDDALGPTLAQEIGRLGLDGVTVDWCDELTIEKALAVAGHDLVVFVTSVFDGSRPCLFKAVSAEESTRVKGRGARQHCGNLAGEPLSPARLLRIAGKLAGCKPEGFVLAIRGYDLGIGEGLSRQARENLAKAVEFLEAAICLRLVA